MAVFVKERNNKIKENIIFMFMIWASQIIGAILGVILVSGGIHMEHCEVKPGIALLCPNDYDHSKEEKFKDKLIGNC